MKFRYNLDSWKHILQSSSAVFIHPLQTCIQIKQGPAGVRHCAGQFIPSSTHKFFNSDCRSLADVVFVEATYILSLCSLPCLRRTVHNIDHQRLDPSRNFLVPTRGFVSVPPLPLPLCLPTLSNMMMLICSQLRSRMARPCGQTASARARARRPSSVQSQSSPRSGDSSSPGSGNGKRSLRKWRLFLEVSSLCRHYVCSSTSGGWANSSSV